MKNILLIQLEGLYISKSLEIQITEREVIVMTNQILVLTNSKDGEHSDVVIKKIRQRGKKVFRFDVDKIATGEVSITFDNHLLDKTYFIIETPDGILASSDIKSVWYRRPNRFALTIQDIVQRQFAEGELRNFLNGLWLMLSQDVFWLNHPISLYRANKKIVQLQLAKQIGFYVPRTLITNNPNQVRKFIKENDGDRVVFKTLYHNFFNYDDKGMIVPTTILTKEHLAHLDLIQATPSIFQEFIEKEFDVRITVVASKMFAVRIDSQAFIETSVDWRKPEFTAKLNYHVIDLPADIVDKCQSMMKKFNLAFAAFDFVVDKRNKDWYFLELNPNGQWYWLEYLTGVDISSAIADILINNKF